ncbi:MAG: helix-turn-helix domain-containing protein [Planctomycetaceae bacterium]|jgi:transposase|nr:helix-turn-helix domain-containing protein [Planctomycetaceae bacterium]
MDWTKKDIADIKRRLSNYETAKHIAKSLKIPTGEFYRLCFVHDINIRVSRGLPKPISSITDPVEREARKAERKAYKKKVAMNRKKREGRTDYIVEMRRNGATYAEIAKKCDLSEERVRQIIQIYNETAEEPLSPEEFNHTRSGCPIVAARREKVAELRRSGLSHREIAKKMKVSVGVIRQDLEYYNRTAENPVPRFVVNKRYRIGAAEKVELVRLRKSGASVPELSAKFGVKPSRIYQVLNSEGIFHDR